jgi:beta-galactosidase GanA
MSNVWPTLVQNGLNTVLGAVAWEDIEPEEGQFVFSNFEKIVEDARRFDLKVVVLWFGAWKNGETDVW